MTGRMMFPKEESWVIKLPKLVLLADSRAERCPLVIGLRPVSAATCAGLSVGPGAGSGTGAFGGVAVMAFFCRAKSSRIFLC